MIDKEQVIRIIFSVVENINNQVGKDMQLIKSIDTLLVDKESKLDSLGLINFILSVEQRIEEEFNITLVLTENEDILFVANGPFKTIGTLSEYITRELGRRCR